MDHSTDFYAALQGEALQQPCRKQGPLLLGQCRCDSPICTAAQAGLLPCTEQNHQGDTLWGNVSWGIPHQMCYHGATFSLVKCCPVPSSTFKIYTPALGCGPRGIHILSLIVVYQTQTEEAQLRDPLCSGLNNTPLKKICLPGTSECDLISKDLCRYN